MDQQGNTRIGEQVCHLLRAVGLVRADARVQGFALLHSADQCACCFFDRGVVVGAMAVEDVDVVESHSGQRLFERGQQIFARATEAVGAGPHVPAGLAGDDQLIAVSGEILGEDAAEVLLRAAVRRAVIVGQIEMRDAEIECATQDRALVHQRYVVAEVVPQSQ